MSYTNHSEGNGVYTYLDSDGYYYCGDCALKLYSKQDFIGHLEYHKSIGCRIPDEVFTKIRTELLE